MKCNWCDAEARSDKAHCKSRSCEGKERRANMSIEEKRYSEARRNGIWELIEPNVSMRNRFLLAPLVCKK